MGEMIFPGMDPYLEDPLAWHEFHQSLIVHIAEQLQPLLAPRFVARVEGRVFVEGPAERSIIPDIAVRRAPSATPRPSSATAIATMEPVLVDVEEQDVAESFIEIVDLSAGQSVVTLIEVVSPTNKFAGRGRDSYLAKQRDVMTSSANLVEVDLLRNGPHVLAVPEVVARMEGPYDYFLSVNRAAARKRFEMYPLRLRERLPSFRLPLTSEVDDVLLDLQLAVTTTYERGYFRVKITYDRRCRPPLCDDDQSWADELIRTALSPSAKNGLSSH